MAFADYRVLTPERVSLQYDIAGIGSRGAAALIDVLIQTAIVLVMLLGVGVGAGMALQAAGAASSDLGFVIMYVIVILALFGVTSGYYILFEIIWSGQTPGKRIVGVRVMRENGYPIRPVDSVIRNLVRIVDSLPVGYAVGVLTMLCNARSKRLGDFAAGTIVVREGTRGRLVGAEPLTVDQPRGPTLRNEDATLVRDFLVRRSGMDRQARDALAARLAGALATRYGLAVEGEPELFLERLGA
jgi:uncharacterized RDD family membrane protein YckC